MRLAPLATLALVPLFLFPHGSLGQTGNECTTVVLHAVPGIDGFCQAGPVCSQVQPTTRIDNPVGPYKVYVALKNYNSVNGLQLAFSWPVSWNFSFGLWHCRPGALVAVSPTSPGPITGTLQATFDPISGGSLALIGVMVFNGIAQSGSGCLSIVESGYPGGNVVFMNDESTPLLDQNEGRVCSNADGWNTCDCRPVADCRDPPFSGTIFIDPDIITSSDPTTFVDAPYAGQGFRWMFDRRVNDWIFVNAYLFNATFDDGLAAEIEVNPEFGSAAAAALQAGRFGPVIGRLPTALRNDVETVWIHMGTELFGGGNNNLLIHIGHADIYDASGILEETFVHEASHTSLDAEHAGSAGWLAAQTADCRFISTYARDFPTREDIAESFLPYLAVRYRSARISQALADTINAAIPHRIAYFGDQAFDMYPISTIGVEEVTPAWTEVRLWQNRPNPFRTSTRIEYQVPTSTRVVVTITDVLGRDVMEIVNDEITAGHQTLEWNGTNDQGGLLPSGIYFMRIDALGARQIKKMILLR